MARKRTGQSVPDERPGPELGAALPYWHAFMEYVRAAAPEAEIAWKAYAGKTGRQCVLRGKKRNLAYLKPGEGSFLVSVALSEKAVAGLDHSGLPRELIAEVRASPRYPEGVPARVRVDSARSLKHAVALLSIKATDAGTRAPARRR